jgi:protoporphyrinogen/coproporphyrinogen III oxidase
VSAASSSQGQAGQRSAEPAVVIVGGGIAGLAAAYFLRGCGLRVVVLEGSPRIGGKLALAEVGGRMVDVGAEALLARRPEGVGVIAELGLSGQLEQPGTTSAGIWTRGKIRPLPRRQFMGVPADPAELAATGILSADGVARVTAEAATPLASLDGDMSVTEVIGGRFGQELVDRLVDPLLGGVYAGRCDDLSFEATLPALAQAGRQHASLTESVAALVPPGQPASAGPPATQPTAGQRPVFTTLAGGLGTLPPALAAASGAEIRTSAMVRELTRTEGGWRLTVGSAHAPEWLEADAVIVALPGRPAGRLLGGAAQAAGAAADRPSLAAAAADLAEIKYASMAIVTLAYPAAAFPRPQSLSGFLVPAVDGHPVKAVTLSTVKWPHLRLAADGQAVAGRTGNDMHLVRCSVGRLGEDGVLQRDDAELAAIAAADLAEATGVTGQPADALVTRWGGGLPQYSVGHLDRVARIRAGVAAQPGLAICGAAYDGVGIPACIGAARQAAEQTLGYLRLRQPGSQPRG